MSRTVLTLRRGLDTMDLEPRKLRTADRLKRSATTERLAAVWQKTGEALSDSMERLNPDRKRHKAT